MIRIIQGDCRARLADLPDGSVHCVVTSPPYFGLRDYGVDGQIGMEPALADYIAELVAVFREVRRVLRPDGSAWVNIGDSYARDPGKGTTGTPNGRNVREMGYSGGGGIPTGLKAGDLMMVPHRLAMALQSDGWWVRQDNVWAKRNCMPESIDDRTTRAHEYVFQLTRSGEPQFWTHRDLPGSRVKPAPDYRWIHRDTKQERADDPGAENKVWRRINLWEGHPYFYDAEAIAEDGAVPAGTRAAKGSNVRSELKDVNGRPPEYWDYNGRRNKRSVWWLATQPFPEAHFATMPPGLAEICIKAGTSEAGCCPGCGAPWARVIEKATTFEGGSGRAGNMPVGKNGAGMQGGGNVNVRRGPVIHPTTTGWRPTCGCPAAAIPCTVLDPFAGAGTTLLVADRLQRYAVGIELHPDYCAMIRRRIDADAPLLAAVAD